MPASDLEIRALTTPEDFAACEVLQAAVWGFDEREIVSAHTQTFMAANGGIILGAFDAQEGLVGFALGFAGLTADGCPKHASHMVGVRREWRGRGVGAQLKWAQREAATQQGLDLVTWTFDPLGAANAHFNFATLGAVCRMYAVEFYGPMRDAINRGLPSDRCVVEWWLRCPRVERHRQGIAARARRGLPRLEWFDADGSPREPTPVSADIGALLLPLPRDFHKQAQSRPEAAVALRLASRPIFQRLFADGYIAAGFDDEHAALLFRRAPLEQVLNED